MKINNNCKYLTRFTIFLMILFVIYYIECSTNKTKIIIGSKNFTEQIILGEIMAAVIENNTSLRVIRKFNLGGTFVCFNALRRGDIDLYSEYTGTGLIAILKKKFVYGKEKTYNIVKKEFKEKFNLVWLNPFEFNNTYTITMRKEQAEELSIRRISDLRKYKEILRPGFNHEFMERADGYKGLQEKYNLQFKHEPREFDTGLMYKAIEKKVVDLICAFATDGRILAFNLVKLKDDLYFFPPYHAAPVVKANILEKYPQIEEVLNTLGGLITDEEMTLMNYKIDQESMSPKKVAREFLINKKIILKQ